MTKKCTVLIFALSLFFLQLGKADAQEESPLPFVVTPVLTVNQSKDVQSYFDLNVNPNQDYDLQFEVRNTVNKPVIVQLDKANAYTASNGGTQYSIETKINKNNIIDEKFKLENNIKLSQSQVALKANETKKVSLKVHVPNVNDSTLLGGILFSKAEESKTGNNDSNFSLNSKINYAMAIKLNVGHQSQHHLSIDKSKIKSTPTGAKIFVSMINQSPAIIKNVKVSYVVSRKGKDLFKGSLNLSKFAPKTKVDAPIDWGGDPPKKGEYQIRFKTTYDGKTAEKKMGMKVKSDKDFVKVQKSDPDTKVVYKDKNSAIAIYLYGILTVFPILLICVIYIYRVRRKVNREGKEK